VATVQRGIRALERKLGVQLVEQAGRRVRLRHPGHVLAREAHAVLRARSDAVNTTIAESGEPQRLLRVAHTFSLGLGFVPAVLTQLLLLAAGARPPPAAVADAARRSLFNVLGTAVGAADSPAVDALLRVARAGDVVVPGRRDTVSEHCGAVVVGTAAHYPRRSGAHARPQVSSSVGDGRAVVATRRSGSAGWRRIRTMCRPADSTPKHPLRSHATSRYSFNRRCATGTRNACRARRARH
jgi:hypothetical protein